jgi:Tfp pilus assembly protein PilF
MRRLVLALLLLGAGILLLLPREPAPRWTTDSPEALAALEAGLDAYMKLYTDEARQHFARALELDPGFLAAKERLGRQSSGETFRRLAEDVRKADLSTVTPAERFLLRYWLAQQVERDRATADRLLADRLEAAPHDPFALHFAASVAVIEGDRQRAETLLEELIKVEPNWVIAQNLLGYLAMEEGQFESAEEHFKTYQYIALDQANPHDSMGELLLLRGRYEEAERELEMALTRRPSFLASYTNLLRIALLERDATKAERILGRVETLPEQGVLEGDPWREAWQSLVCHRDIHLGFVEGRWEEAWHRGGPCLGSPLGAVLIHRTGLVLGLDEETARIRSNFRHWLEGLGPSTRNRTPEAMMLHIEGDFHLAAAQPEAAARRFREADDLLLFGTDGQALFKLYTQGQLALAVTEAGSEWADGEDVWQRIAAVNPRIRPFLEAGGWPLLERARRSPHNPESTAPPG